MAGRAMAPFARDVVLLKAGTPIPDGAGGTRPGPVTEHPCKGWIADYSDLSKLSAMRPMADRKLVILARTLDVDPTIKDHARIDGQTFNIRDVSTDPAKAAWKLQCFT